MKNYIIGGLITLIGIILAVFFKEPHFYTFFSIGLFVIFLEVYKHIVHHRLFARWNFESYLLFWLLLLVASLGIDLIGLKLGYWDYPLYASTFDTYVKYIIEWCIALMYITLTFFIGVAIFKKHHMRTLNAVVLTLIVVVIPVGFITEYFNHMATSWVIYKMPLTSYEIGGYFIMLQTVGYWIMALIPWIIYKIVGHVRNAFV